MSAGVPLSVWVPAIVERATIANVTTYLREVGRVAGVDQDVPPPTISDDDLRVRPYIVVYPSPGGPSGDVRFDGSTVGKSGSFQLTCVVGDESALDVLLDVVLARFDDWRPVLPAPYDGLPIGRCRLISDVGPSRRDDAETPTRFWVPLIYSNTINH